MGIDRKKEKAIFDAAMEFENPEERNAYVIKACGDDVELLSSIQKLLEYHDSSSFLDAPVFESDTIIDITPISEDSGTVIGRYKLLEKIGEGGMATVYMAEQERPMHRRVALKIIKLGMDTKQVIGRFEAERQALAMMDHPNIATVLDAGTTETGRPYFVMELVRGLPIIEFCDKNNLNTEERLELFISVCHAVQHAHQRGIIHRDIKPSNVLVTLHDGKPVAKVIDFGIAKALNQRLTEKTVFTRYSQMIGTPEYMSPEQAEMSGLDIDTRSDVFSLGVLLYELLTGATPFNSEYLLRKGYGEMQRIIREEEPMRPSTKMSTIGEALTEVAQHRKTTPEVLRKTVRGDLDWIVMKTLEKDRAHRYQTVYALAEDIARHLKNEPITASSPGTFYRIHKFIKRNRVKVMMWSSAAVIVIGFLFVFNLYFHFRTERNKNDHIRSISLVEDLITNGDYENALTEVQPYLSSKFVGSKAQLLNARILLELQRPDASIEQLNKLLNEQSEIAANAHLLLARIYLESASGDPHMEDKADVHMEQGEKLMPSTAEAYLLRAMISQTVQETLGWLADALELDPSNYSARRTRALTYYALGEYREMETETSVMVGSQPKNPAGYSLRAIARRELALQQNNSEMLNEALDDHNRAVGLTSPSDKRLEEICYQRYQTLMKMSKYDYALTDIQTCMNIQPEEPLYHFNMFCTLLAMGDYEEAQAEYDNIQNSRLMDRMRFDNMIAKYVFDSLCSQVSFYPKNRPPEGKAFVSMYEAVRQYNQLAERARRVVAEGFHPSISPDGTKLAYSRGVLGASAIEILNLSTGKTQLLTVPGKDPAWSPDGEYILYVRDRHVLSIKGLTSPGELAHQPFEQEEIWIIKAEGKERPRFLAQGGWPNWTSDSSRFYYKSRLNNMVYSLSLDSNNTEPREVFVCNSTFPVVSPDENLIAFTDKKSGTLQVVDLISQSVLASWSGPKGKINEMTFISWSPDGKQLAIGSYLDEGLWIYDIDNKTAAKLIDGFYAWCGWSAHDNNKMFIERVYGSWHHEIWIADVAKDGIPVVNPK
ncbi:MAG: protein kinase [Sedimentisphaerales bacterium]|nr:protein kinase [Sedimentisphaerales bacterium]